MANQQNIEKHKFKPGNKFGKPRPKGPSMTTLLKKFMSSSMNMSQKSVKTFFDKAKELGFDLDDKKMTAGEMMLLKIIHGAINGDHRSAREILDRVEGKPIQRIENTEMTHEDWLERVKGEIADEE